MKGLRRKVRPARRAGSARRGRKPGHNANSAQACEINPVHGLRTEVRRWPACADQRAGPACRTGKRNVHLPHGCGVALAECGPSFVILERMNFYTSGPFAPGDPPRSAGLALNLAMLLDVRLERRLALIGAVTLFGLLISWWLASWADSGLWDGLSPSRRLPTPAPLICSQRWPSTGTSQRMLPRVGQVWVAYAAPLRASQRQALRRHDHTRLTHLYSSCFHPSRSPPTCRAAQRTTSPAKPATAYPRL